MRDQQLLSLVHTSFIHQNIGLRWSFRAPIMKKKLKKKQIGRKILEDLSIVVHFMN